MRGNTTTRGRGKGGNRSNHRGNRKEPYNGSNASPTSGNAKFLLTLMRHPESVKLPASDKNAKCVKNREKDLVKSFINLDSTTCKEVAACMNNDQAVANMIDWLAECVCSAMDVKDFVLPFFKKLLSDDFNRGACRGVVSRVSCDIMKEPMFMASLWTHFPKDKDSLTSLISVSKFILNVALTNVIQVQECKDTIKMVNFLKDNHVAGHRELTTVIGGSTTGIDVRTVNDLVEEDTPGGRHDNDHVNYRSISNLPSIEEITCEELPYLPTADMLYRENKEEQTGMELDYQFRLARENIVGPLREAWNQYERAYAISPSVGLQKLRSSTIPFWEHIEVNNICFDTRRIGVYVEMSVELPLRCPIYDKKKFKNQRAFWESPAGGRTLKRDSLCLIVVEGVPITFAQLARREDQPPRPKYDEDGTTKLANTGPELHNRVTVPGVNGAMDRIIHRPIIGMRMDESGLLAMSQFINRGPQKNSFIAVVNDSYFSHEPVLQALKRITKIPLYLDLRIQPEVWEKDQMCYILRTKPGDAITPGIGSEVKLRQLYKKGVVCEQDHEGMVKVSVQNETYMIEPERLRTEAPTTITYLDNIDRYKEFKRLEDANGFKFDAAQNASLHLGLSAATTIIHGPPGTGKSLMGVNLIDMIFKNTDVKILVLTYTNHALDDVLKGLIKSGITDICRIGAKCDPDLDAYALFKKLDNSGNNKTHEHRKAFGISRRELETLETKLNHCSSSLSEMSLAPTHFKYWKNIENYLTYDSLEINWMESFKPGNYDGFQTVGEKGKKVNAHTVYMAWRKGDVKPPCETISNTLWELNKTERAEMLQDWHDEIKEDLTAAIARLSENAMRRLNVLEDLNRNGWRAIFEKSRIIGVTTTAAAKYKDVLNELDIGVIVVEEAGEVLQTHTYTSLNANAKHHILIGDHKQLRPKIDNYNLTIQAEHGHEFNKSTFERLVYSALPVSGLTMQHRMQPDISSLIRDTYPNLVDGPKTMTDRQKVRGLSKSVCFIDHRELEEADRTDGEVDSTKKQNGYEVKMVIATLRYLMKQGHKKLENDDEIVILTPYLAQMFEIRTALNALNLNSIVSDLDADGLAKEGLASDDDTALIQSVETKRKNIRVSTVDNYQGEEADIVLLSLVRSNRGGRIGFIGEAERVNVMLSRAREGMIIFGNSETLTKKTGSVWNDKIEMMKEKHMVIPGLPIYCEFHEAGMMLQTPQDFDTHCPDGGCIKDCGELMSCGHTCPLKCHPVDRNHRNVACNVIMEGFCESRHFIDFECGDRENPKCKTCDEIARALTRHKNELEKMKVARRLQQRKLEEAHNKKKMDIEKRNLELTLELEQIKEQERLAALEEESLIRQATLIATLNNKKKSMACVDEVTSADDKMQQLIIKKEAEQLAKEAEIQKRKDDIAQRQLLANKLQDSTLTDLAELDSLSIRNEQEVRKLNAEQAKKIDASQRKLASLSNTNNQSNGLDILDDIAKDLNTRTCLRATLKSFESRIRTVQGQNYKFLFDAIRSMNMKTSPWPTELEHPNGLEKFNEGDYLEAQEYFEGVTNQTDGVKQYALIAKFMLLSKDDDTPDMNQPFLIPILMELLLAQYHSHTNNPMDALIYSVKFVSLPYQIPKGLLDIAAHVFKSNSKAIDERRKAAAANNKQQDKLNNMRKQAVGSQALNKLIDLTGLFKVKECMLQIAATAKMDKRKGENPADKNYHAIFTGNPGTGKTTVARIYANLLFELNIIPEAEFVETSGAKLTDGGVALLNEQLQKLANGGVLFVDEAYQLSPVKNPIGASVLNLLLTEMENLRGKLVVVFAGYAKDLEELMMFNEGLPSRFVHNINFEDFTDPELVEIFKGTVKAYEAKANVRYQFEDEKHIRIAMQRIGRGRGITGFGNARAVRNSWEAVLRAQSKRLIDAEAKGLAPRLFDLLREDLLGPRIADFANIPGVDDLDKLYGLKAVKTQVRNMMTMIETNLEREENEQTLSVLNLNRVLLGNPGTGKTTVAKIYGKILKGLGLLSKGDVMIKNPHDFIGSHIGESEKNTAGILESAKGNVLVIDEAYGLDPCTSDNKTSGTCPFKNGVIDTIVAKVQGVPGEDMVVLLCGYADPMNHMMKNANPGLARRFNIADAWVFEDYNSTALFKILGDMVNSKQRTATTETKKLVIKQLDKLRMKPNFGNGGEVANILSRALERFEERNQSLPAWERANATELKVEDFLGGVPVDVVTDDPERLFDGLIGVDCAKEKVMEIAKVAKRLKEKGKNPLDTIGLNFRFVGPPGTGKTTVARRLGRLFKAIGLLASDECVQCSAPDLIGQYVGSTAPKVREKFREARGGVLFIDEAYRLADSRGSFAKEAIDEIVNLLTEEEFKNKMVVIFAGYENEMNDMFNNVNPGLKSRVTEVVRFEPFGGDDVVELMHLRLAQKDCVLDNEALIILPIFAEDLANAPSFANGRDAETWLDKVVVEHIKCDGAEDQDGKNIITESMLSKTFDELMRDRKTSKAITTPSQPSPDLFAPPLVDTQKPTTVSTTTRANSDIEAEEEEEEAAVAENNRGGMPILEEIVKALGYDESFERLQQLVSELEPAEKGEKLPLSIIEYVIENCNVADKSHQCISSLLRPQVRPLLYGTRAAVQAETERRIMLARLEKEERERQEKLHAEKMAKVQRIGRCPAGFAWHQENGGWRCGGGSHWVSDAELNRH